VLDPVEISFARQALAKSKTATSEQWDFAAAHLQHPSSEISSAAYNLLAAAPLEEVQKRAKLVGDDKLFQWVKDGKVAPERRALYLLMCYRNLSPQKAGWLGNELFSDNLASTSPLVGPLAVAYLHLLGQEGLQNVQRKFYAQSLPAGRTTPLNRALTLVGEQTSDSGLKNAIRELFRRELSHPQRGPFVLAPLAIWQDYSAAGQVEKLFHENREIPWVKVAVIRYFRSFGNGQAQAALKRLAQTDPQLVSRTTDGYRRSDLGID
jgi:hypothetical protein